MNFNNIKNLIFYNLLFSVQPQVLEKIRTKQKNNIAKKSIQNSILMQHLILGITYLAIFGLTAFMVRGDEAKFIGFISGFTIFAILQGILVVFNIFYETDDLHIYRSLPFTDTEVFVSKMAVAIISIIYFVIPIVAHCIIFEFAFDHNIFQKIFMGLFSSALLFTGIALTMPVATYLLTKLPAFKKHKKLASSVMTILVIVGTVLMVVMMNSGMYDSTGELSKGNPILKSNPVFWVFYGLASNPFSIKTLINLIVWIVFLTLEAFVCVKVIMPNIYADASNMRSIISSRKKKKLISKGTSLNSSLTHYHFGFLSDSAVLTSLVMPAIMLFAMTAPNMFTFHKELQGFEFTQSFILPMAVIAVVVAFFSQGVLSSIIISLDKDNYNYIKSLPFDMKYYIKFKLKFSYLVQSVLPVVLLILVGLFMNVPMYMVAISIFTYMLTGIPISLNTIKKDHRNLLLDWQSVNQLVMRGGSKGAIFLKVFLVMTVGIIAVVVSFFIATYASFNIILVLLGIIYIALTIYLIVNYILTKKYFEKAFNE